MNDKEKLSKYLMLTSRMQSTHPAQGAPSGAWGVKMAMIRLSETKYQGNVYGKATVLSLKFLI